MAKASASYSIVRIDDGVGISSTTFSYMATETNERPSESSTSWVDWSAAYAEFGAEKRFLWQKETITYTDGNEHTEIFNITVYSSGEIVIIQYCYGDENEPFDADFLIGTDTYVIGTDDCVIGQNIWTEEELPQVTGQSIWRREGKYNPDTAIFPTSWVVTRVTGDSAFVFDFELTSQTYPTNKRLTGLSEIQLNENVQGYTTYTISWSTDHGSFSSSDPTATTTTSSNPKLYIPYTETSVITVTLTGSYAGTTLGPVTKKISNVDETEYNHDFGTVSTLPSSYTDSSGRTCYLLAGDYFVASAVFSLGSENTVIGYPYIYSSSWSILDISSTLDPTDAERLLNCLSNIMSYNAGKQPSDSDYMDLPTSSPLYTWCANFVAQTAVINAIFSRMITILNPGYIKSSNFEEVDGFVSQGFKLSSSGLGQFGKGTQLCDVDLRINDDDAGTQVQLLTTSKYAQGATYAIPAKSRWLTNELFSSTTHWNKCPSPSTDNPNVSYNGSNYYPLKRDFSFKPGETNNYVLTFDKACTVTLYFNGNTYGVGRYVDYLIINGSNYRYYIGASSPQESSTVTYTTNVSAGGSITVNTRNFPYKPNNTGTENDGVRALGSPSISVKVNGVTASAVLCNNRVYSTLSSNSPMPTAGTYNFTVFPADTYIANSLAFTHTYNGGGTTSSSDYLNYTNLSNLASIADGNYLCTNSAINSVTVDGINKISNTITVSFDNDTQAAYSTSPDTSTFATTGWYSIAGSITLVGSTSAVVTHNIEASSNAARIGATHPYDDIHAKTFTADTKHIGNVNDSNSSTQYDVWGAVFN